MRDCVETDRWTCPEPGCGRTVTVHALLHNDVLAALWAVQQRHGNAHAAARRRAQHRATLAALDARKKATT